MKQEDIDAHDTRRKEWTAGSPSAKVLHTWRNNDDDYPVSYYVIVYTHTETMLDFLRIFGPAHSTHMSNDRRIHGEEFK